jgi:hypothetical protein
MARMVRTGNVDIITGDWLSEMNIAWNAITKAANPSLGYEAGFLTQLSTCLEEIVERKLKVITNAGALNTAALKQRVEELCQERGLGDKVVVASVVGDDVSELLKEKDGLRSLTHLDHSEWSLGQWDREEEITCGVAYIGAWGIVEALKAGADIVICGRVTDASPVIGAAAWWYGWDEESYDELAGALVAGREYLSHTVPASGSCHSAITCSFILMITGTSDQETDTSSRSHRVRPLCNGRQLLWLQSPPPLPH